MTWTVHRLQSVLFAFALDPKDILFVFVIMSRVFPKLGTINIGTNNFVVASNLILSSHEFLKSAINYSTVRIE